MAGVLNHIIRREIPKLFPRTSRIGKVGTLRRSFPTGPGDYFRVYNNEPLHLAVEVLKEFHDLTLVLHTNLGSYDGVWQEHIFQEVSPGRYTVDVPTDKCGLFRFKIKYTLDGGQSWIWDRVPFSEVLVDPSNARCVIMYTMIPTVSGHIGDWKELLHKISEMNFNTVHLLPVTKMGSSESPYAANDLFDIDESYLDPSDSRSGLDQFEDFVETARSLDVRLCMDLVLNHVGVDSEPVRSCPGWIVADKSEPDGIQRAGCWHENQWLKWEDLAKINYNHPQRKVKADIWRYMTEYALFWSNYAAYTGGLIRFDNLHSSHQGFITHCTRAIRREYRNIVLLAEYFSDLQTLERQVPEWNLNLLLANPWDYHFAPQLREYISFLHNASAKLRHFAPITSHDSGSPTQQFGTADATVARYFIMALFTTGQTGIVQGVEHAVPEKVEFIGRNPKLQPHVENTFTPFITRVNELMLGHDVFTNAGNLQFVDCGHESILAALRFGRFCGDNSVLLLANLDTHHQQSIELDLGHLDFNYPLQLRDMLADEDVELTGQHFRFVLDPSGVKVFELR